MPTLLWEGLKWREVQEARDAGAVVILPVGATEQHGPHLPLGVDTLGAYEVAVHGGNLVEESSVLVMPPLPYGLSANHIEFPGTVTLTGETLSRVVSEICRCLWGHGFRRILLLNGHTGNIGPLQNAVVSLAAEGIIAATSTYWTIVEDDLPRILKADKEGTHAGEWETSLTLHLRPALVDMSRAVKDLRRPHHRAASFAWINRPPRDSGIYGDATAATAETGKKILEAHAARVAQFVREWKRVEVPSDWRRD